MAYTNLLIVTDPTNLPYRTYFMRRDDIFPRGLDPLYDSYRVYRYGIDRCVELS